MSDAGYTYYDQMEQNSRSVSIEQLQGKKRDKLQSQKLEWQRERVVHFEPQDGKH